MKQAKKSANNDSRNTMTCNKISKRPHIAGIDGGGSQTNKINI